jgi:hypothetical protein
VRKDTPLYISADVSVWRSYMCNRLPSSGQVYTFQRVLGQREGGGMVKKGEGRKGPNFIAKFGRYFSIIGASEDPEENIR